MKEKKTLMIFILLYIAVFLLAFSLGRYPITPLKLMKILFAQIFPIECTWTSQEETIVFALRIPRILLSSFVGASLALSGLLFQTVFQNPLASQDVLGSGEASAFGASLALLLGLPYAMVSLSAFLFGLSSIAIVTFLGRKVHGDGKVALILSGIMVSSIFTSLTSFVKLVADTEETLPEITYWLMGSLSSFRENDIVFMAFILLVAATPVVLLKWRLNLLSLKEEEAMSIGVDVKRLKTLAILSATLLTSASVAVSGSIGWVGLVIPHFTRSFAGYDTKHLVPLSIISGAAFLTLVDTISRTLTTTEIPLGIITSFVGAPFFIYLITKSRRMR